MRTMHTENWWALALRGVAAIVFGIIALFWPGITATVMIILFGAYAFADGVFALAAGIRAAHQGGRSWPLLLEGVLDLVAGAIVFLWPGPSLLVLIYLIAIWAVITGVVLVVAGIHLRRIRGEWLLILGGVLSVLLGAILFRAPIAGILVLSWWIGAYALLFGVALLALALRLRRRQPAA